MCAVLHMECHLPIDVSTLMLFMAHLSEQDLAPSTITSYMSAIAYVHKLGGYHDPTQFFMVRKMLVGLQKTGGKPDFRKPITKPILHQLLGALNTICSSHYDKLLFQSMFLLAFHAFLRIGEVVNNGRTQNILKLSNIQFFRQGNIYPSRLEVTFDSYKGHYNTSPVTLSLTTQVDASRCPVQCLFNFLQVRGSKEGPIYVFPNGKPISYQYFCNTLKQALVVAGYKPDAYRSHSFRIGAASSAASQGVPEADIQAMGRWHSDAFKRYIRIPAFEV